MTRMIASKISDTEYEILIKAVQSEGNNVSAFIRDLIIKELRDKEKTFLFHNSPVVPNNEMKQTEEQPIMSRLYRQYCEHKNIFL